MPYSQKELSLISKYYSKFDELKNMFKKKIWIQLEVLRENWLVYDLNEYIYMIVRDEKQFEDWLRDEFPVFRESKYTVAADRLSTTRSKITDINLLLEDWQPWWLCCPTLFRKFEVKDHSYMINLAKKHLGFNSLEFWGDFSRSTCSKLMSIDDPIFLAKIKHMALDVYIMEGAGYIDRRFPTLHLVVGLDTMESQLRDAVKKFEQQSRQMPTS